MEIQPHAHTFLLSLLNAVQIGSTLLTLNLYDTDTCPHVHKANVLSLCALASVRSYEEAQMAVAKALEGTRSIYSVK
jgi:hypothetical protein